MPVKKGDYWRVINSIQTNNLDKVYWLPIESGSGSGATDSRFGGAYMHDGTANKVCINSNPQTGGCSCPSGFTASMSGQTNTAGHDIFICQK